MSIVIERTEQEIRKRLDELAPVVLEVQRLERARDALAGVRAPRRFVSPRSRRRGQGRRPYANGGERAARGSNRKAILRSLRWRPLSLAALVHDTGIEKRTLATTLSQMKATGLVDNAGGRWGLTPAGAREVPS